MSEKTKPDHELTAEELAHDAFPEKMRRGNTYGLRVEIVERILAAGREQGKWVECPGCDEHAPGFANGLPDEQCDLCSKATPGRITREHAERLRVREVLAKMQGCYSAYSYDRGSSAAWRALEDAIAAMRDREEE